MKDLALHILDISQNSLRASASEIRIDIAVDHCKDLFTVTIADNGCGMDEETLARAADPYFTSRTTRKVGLGLSLLKMNATQAGGDVAITSAPGVGTTVVATFIYSHIDRPPAGDIGGTVTLLITSNPEVNFIYHHTIDGKTWDISTSEIKDALGDIAVNDIGIIKYLREIIRENTSDLSYIKQNNDKRQQYN